ncbi:MAG: rhomboid family intramembrane serine protease, partial [Myxococcales bacterium]
AMMSSDDDLSSWEEAPANRRIDLVGGGAILFESDGFRVLESRGRTRSPLHAYESMTHVYVADQMLLIGLNSKLLTIRNGRFRDPEEGPSDARRLLLSRLAERPDGRHWLDEMDRLDRLGNRKTVSWVTWTTVVLCVFGTWFQLRDPMIEQVGAFVPDLFTRGEFWRGVTAHFLHGLPRLPFHLAVNVGGLVVLGHLVERPLGSWRTAAILGAGAIGTIAGIQFGDQQTVLGSSGLVSALAGAILALEFNYPESLPAFWRLPRRLFVAVLILQFVVIDRLLSDYVAGGAHLGGFLAGYFAAWNLGRPTLESLIPTPPQRLAAYVTAVFLILGILGSLPLMRHDMNALERHASRLLNSPTRLDLYPHENAAAWFIATGGGASSAALEYAVALADRAVASTQRMHPDILDTLAEALFQRGDRVGALLTIEEAIRLVPSEPYFIEQRRRFTGERAEDDRPPPPGSAPQDQSVDGDDLLPHPIDLNAPRMTI